MLDINKLREDRGGEPDLVRDSQRRRGISPDSVDECIAADKAWSKGACIYGGIVLFACSPLHSNMLGALHCCCNFYKFPDS